MISSLKNVKQKLKRIPIKPIPSTGSDDFPYPLSVDMPNLVNRILSNLSVPYKPINDPKFPILISESDKCRQVKINTGLELEFLILIKSAPSNSIHRDTIRMTWGNSDCWGGRRVVSLFLLGSVSSTNTELNSLIRNESVFYHDIIQQDFHDHYFNNTYKIMFGLEWVVNYCSTVPMIMFADDDYFIYPKNALAYLENLSQSLELVQISGYVWTGAIPIRNKRLYVKKWYVSKSEYPHSTYPPYVSAGNFFLSMHMAKRINVAMRYTKYFRFDDVYLGIILKKLLHVPIHLNQVYTYIPVNETSNFIYGMISSHQYGNPIAQLSLWTRLKCGLFCTNIKKK